MSFKLLKDIISPGLTLSVGTEGVRMPFTEKFLFGTGKQTINFFTDYMLKHPDHFQYTGGIRWSDEDMVNFALLCQSQDTVIGRIEIEDKLVDFINPNNVHE